MIFFTWRSAILKSELPSTTKLVLLVLSTYMDDHGSGAFPSMETMAADAGLSKRAVIKQIQIATDAGFIVVSKHGYGGQKWARNEYKIAFPSTKRGEPDSPPIPEKVVNDDHQLDQEGGELESPPLAEVVNDVPKGGEPDDTKVVNQVHSISPLTSPLNSPVNPVGSEIQRDGIGAASSSLPEDINKPFAMFIDWYPRDQFLGLLQRAGIPNTHPWEDDLLDFWLYRIAKGEKKNQAGWEQKFLQDVVRNKRFRESESKPIPIDWAPSEQFWPLIAQRGIDVAFAQAQIPEFIFVLVRCRRKKAVVDIRMPRVCQIPLDASPRGRAAAAKHIRATNRSVMGGRYRTSPWTKANRISRRAHMNAITPMDTQVGGAHYKSMAIQPAEFWIRNQLPSAEGSAVKYVTRHRDKNGRQDCEKALHFVQIMRWWYFDAPMNERVMPLHFRGQRNFDISPKQYCDANQLTNEESAAIQLICTFSCREQLVIAESLIERIIARDYADVSPPAAQLPRSDILYLAKQQLEHYASVLQTTAAPPSQIDRVKSVIDRIDAEWRAR